MGDEVPWLELIQCTEDNCKSAEVGGFYVGVHLSNAAKICVIRIRTVRGREITAPRMRREGAERTGRVRGVRDGARHMFSK